VSRCYFWVCLSEKSPTNQAAHLYKWYKSNGKYLVVKTIGSSKSEQGIEKLHFLAKQELERISVQPKLFVSENDTLIEHVFDALQNASIKTVGPEISFGKIYDHIGFNSINEELFRHLVIARLAFPLSKLKTIEL
jgi:hypothetical protein